MGKRRLTLKFCVVGGNAVSAFLSWRLQSTNSCDVTLVWKSGFESVAQYGVSFRSKKFGNERFKPRHVVRTPEEAASREAAYDYVVLSVKALPDIYDLGSVIESVVTPQHTCILVNTTNTLGVESHLEQRFPTNVVLSLVSNAVINQTGISDFEHEGSTEMWVGPASKNPSIPASIQNDMASALAMTLSSGQVDCKVSSNIRQEQFDRMIGPVAFHPTSVLFNTPNHSQLLEKVGVRQLVNDVIDELLKLASTQGCSFDSGYRKKVIERMTAAPAETQTTTMYQDFLARRPMEVETYLGSPVRLAMESNISLPRIETLYAMLHHVNIVNQTKPYSESPPPGITTQFPPRIASVPPTQQQKPPIANGMRASRTSSNMGMPMPPPQQRRGPPPGGPMLRPPSAQAGPSRMPPRDASFDDNGLEEFSHLVVYDDIIPSDGPPNGNMDMPNGGANGNLALRERELALRQRELQLREREMNMRQRPPGPRSGGPRAPPPPRSVFDEEDEDDYFDPQDFRPPPGLDPDNIDMMSVTSRRTRKAPSAGQLRRNPEMNGPPSRPSSSFRFFSGQGGRKSTTSSRLINDIPMTHSSLMDDPLMAYSSNRYGAVDRKELHMDSRANSLSTVSRMGDFGPAGQSGPYPPGPVRRTSGSPAAFGPPNGRGMPRPATGDHQQSWGPPQQRPSPPNMRQPVPRYPPVNGNNTAAEQVEQHLGRGEW
ncbi:2-dehydropantoate 2-reductase, putative [Talaromyces stipitatus ATCC 10500]|uniref:2-dehydropantoate 2-reductase, putative n=1 Tax=Talaromyces stipitatus (strain ATCC 10500 / CBS 375.48 / QM 6759 / NRRL 1006) TaxID=441959 RepID=B8MKN3_TALSN|nr:2-dehydropantoate 2-reductase, putative [Talaromyces stipitatus ATCC 10500]EED15388.1 2-dehydropantoate 2-reductase, putative [Talaromyces stipitatus ATCC 10500]